MVNFPNANFKIERNPKRTIVEELEKKLETGEVDVDDMKNWLAEKIDFIYTDMKLRIDNNRVVRVDHQDPAVGEDMKQNWNGLCDRIKAVIDSINIKL